jgi:hypothetical protein
LCGNSLDRRLQVPSAEGVLRQTERHADPCRRKAEMPVHALCEVAGNQRPDERTEVDAHVEDRKACVTTRVARWVERAHERADVWFEKAGTDDDQAKASVEEGKRLERQAEVAERDDRAADEDAAVLPEESIGDDATEDRSRPNTAGVGSINGGGIRVREAKPSVGCRRDHVEDQERPHPVVTEPLPHFGEKKG